MGEIFHILLRRYSCSLHNRSCNLTRNLDYLGDGSLPRTNPPPKKPFAQYDHRDKEWLNNPPVVLVTADTDRESTKKIYTYDPHLDSSLQWASKAEHTSFNNYFYLIASKNKQS
jgi:hypothetical protein